MYKLLRLIGRLDPAFSVYQGLASHTVDVSRLADGECSPPPLSVHLTLQCVMIHGVVSADIPSSSRTVPCRSPPPGAFSAWIDAGSSAECVSTHLVPALQAPRCFLTRLVLTAVCGLATLADTVLTQEASTPIRPTSTHASTLLPSTKPLALTVSVGFPLYTSCVTGFESTKPVSRRARSVALCRWWSHPPRPAAMQAASQSRSALQRADPRASRMAGVAHAA
jgi:hypothetical protein